MQHSSIPSSDDVVKVIANFNSTLYLSNHGIYYRPKLKYSTDGNIWYTYEGELSIITNQTIYLKGDNPTGWSQNSLDYSSILIKGKVSLSGNIMGLLDNGTEQLHQYRIATAFIVYSKTPLG